MKLLTKLSGIVFVFFIVLSIHDKKAKITGLLVSFSAVIVFATLIPVKKDDRQYTEQETDFFKNGINKN